MQDSKYYIPKYIDEPFKVVIFTIDEVVLILAIMMIAFIVGYVIIGIAVTTVCCALYRKLKAQESSAFIRRYIYWHYNFGSSNVLPKSSTKKFKG